MTRIFTEDGTSRAVTALEAKPVAVSEIKSEEKNGYDAVKVSVTDRKKINFAEFRSTAGKIDIKIGDKITTESFAAGDKITVIGTSKGKGFAGDSFEGVPCHGTGVAVACMRCNQCDHFPRQIGKNRVCNIAIHNLLELMRVAAVPGTCNR